MIETRTCALPLIGKDVAGKRAERTYRRGVTTPTPTRLALVSPVW